MQQADTNYNETADDCQRLKGVIVTNAFCSTPILSYSLGVKGITAD